MDQRSLPFPGKISCSRCYGSPVEFNSTRQKSADGKWRITSNPIAWGSPDAEVLVLGFSKGPNQLKALETKGLDQIAFAGGRANLGKILRHIGLAPNVVNENEHLKAFVDREIANKSGRFAWGSLVRCTAEHFKENTNEWTGTSSNILSRFLDSDMGEEVSRACISQHLSSLSTRTKLIIMLGMGPQGKYVRQCREAYSGALGGAWRSFNEIAYTNGPLTVVHTEHFKAQGHLLQDWLGETGRERQRFGFLAQQAVAFSGLAVGV